MSDSKKMLDQLLDEAGKTIDINASIIVDKASGKNVANHMADTDIHHSVETINGLIGTAMEALKNGDLKSLQDSMTALSSTVNTFLTGEPDDNGTLDRLKELVASIEENRGNIDALVADHVKRTEIINDLTSGGTDKVLSAEQGKILKDSLDTLQASTHTHANKETLNNIGKADSGNLTFNGKELTGSGIAIIGTADEASPVFDAKLKFVVTEYSVGA